MSDMSKIFHDLHTGREEERKRERIAKARYAVYGLRKDGKLRAVPDAYYETEEEAQVDRTKWESLNPGQKWAVVELHKGGTQ